MNYIQMSEDEKLKQEIRSISNKINNILTILKGETISDEPSGLIYSVSENTKFRKNVSKLVWVIIAANSGIGIYFIAKVIELLQNGG